MNILIKDIDLSDDNTIYIKKIDGKYYARHSHVMGFSSEVEPLPPNLIDVDKFKADYHMGDDCPTCEQNTRSCEYDRIYSKMDFCSWLDDAERIGEENE